jgi:predicted dinucleotide-binding enzyme
VLRAPQDDVQQNRNEVYAFLRQPIKILAPIIGVGRLRENALLLKIPAGDIVMLAPASAQVVKAFNTLFGHVLAKDKRLDAFIAADDADAKARVSTFLESLGLRPLDVGGLQMAQTLEWLGLMMIGLAKNGAGTWDISMNVDIG